MKVKIFVLLNFLLTLGFGHLFAQDYSNKIAISGLGGLVIPTGDFATNDPGKGNAKSGHSVGGRLEFFANKNISFGVTLMYSAFEDKDSSNITNKLIDYGVLGRYIFNPRSKISTYLKLGIHLCGLKIETSPSPSPQTTWDFDLNPSLSVGLGLTYKLSSNLRLFSEATHNRLFVKNADYTIFTVPYRGLGYDVQYFGIYAGVIFYVTFKSSSNIK